METNKYNPVKATPVKSFFVEMLTRDIDLVDAILDLLDNCVDGILRQRKSYSVETPYEGFKAEINFDENSFSISDNCGGIPWEQHGYAFRMGKEREDQNLNLPTIGVYGIGMKRAIFKIGKQCSISTRNQKDCYAVKIPPGWIENSKDWELPVIESSRPEEEGTTIVINELNTGIASHFDKDNKVFTRELTKKIKTHYASILGKGFRVVINGNEVKAETTRLLLTDINDTESIDRAIRPYIYQAKFEEVNIFLCVGFIRPIPSQEEVNVEQETKQFSSKNAGWTVICNDRAVLYCDRSQLTGWGDAGVPKYHTQFIAIYGIVEFQSNDPAKLPTTTTKRGVDASSPLYLQVRQRMMEGMQIFTNYTNKWKGRPDESKEHMKAAKRQCTLDELKQEFPNLPSTNLSKGFGGAHFKPKLPQPKPEPSSKRRISYSKNLDDIETVQNHLFGDEEVKPSQVGEKCFDQILKEAKQ